MRDSRFATQCESLSELLETLDVDSLEELELFLMYLFDRRIDVRDEESGLEVIAFGQSLALGVVHAYPISVEEIVAGLLTEEDLEYLGTYEDGGNGKYAGIVFGHLDADDLTAALIDALGAVRIMTMLG